MPSEDKVNRSRQRSYQGSFRAKSRKKIFTVSDQAVIGQGVEKAQTGGKVPSVVPVRRVSIQADPKRRADDEKSG